MQLSPNESVLARKCDASAFETWHPLQADEIGLHRIDPALRIGDLIQVADQRQVVLLACY